MKVPKKLNRKETSKKEGTEKLMRRLGGSLVSWLTFQQAALRSKMYYEHSMYSPLFEVATARAWKIRPQYPLKVGKAQKYVDFVFYGTTKKHPDNDRVAAVEVSYIRTSSRANKISADENKLKQFDDKSFLEGKCGSIRRYILVAAKEHDLKNYCKSNLPRAMPLFGKANPGSLGWIYRSPINFSNESGMSSRWCVMILKVKSKS